MTRGITEQFFDMMLGAQKREAEYRQSKQQAAQQNHEAVSQLSRAENLCCTSIFLIIGAILWLFTQDWSNAAFGYLMSF